MDKTLIIADWFKNNNERLNKELLNKLCCYAMIMFNGASINSFDNNLTKEEIKVLKIVNRVFGYANIEDLQVEYNDNFVNYLKEIYETYKDEELNERVEWINGKCFFIKDGIKLTKDDYSKLESMILNEDNITYYIDRNTQGVLVVY